VSPLGFLHPKGMALDHNSGMLFVAVRDTNEVVVFSLATLQVVDRIDVGTEPFDVGLLDGILYVTNFASGSISRIDVATRTRILPDIPVAANPTWVDVDPISGRVYVVMKSINGVAVLRGGAVWRVLGAGRGAFAVAVDSVGRRAYVTNRDDNTFTVIDVDWDSVLATWGLEGTPFGVAVNPWNGDVYIAHGVLPRDCPAYRLSIWNRSGNWVREVDVGDSCDGGWLDINPFNSRVYLAATALNQVWVLNGDGSVRSVLTTAQGMGIQPFGLAVDPATSLIYVGNKGDNTLKVILDP